MQRGRGDQDSWRRTSSLPSTLIPLLYPGPLDQGDLTTGAAQPETSEREEEHEQERPYALRPVPLFPSTPSMSALILTPAAFGGSHERGARPQTRSPESEGSQAAGSARLGEASFFPQPAPPFGRNTLRTDPAYYTAGSSYAFTYTYPPPPPPAWRTPVWRQGEAGPSSYAGATGDGGSHASGLRYTRQEQPVASSSQLPPGPPAMGYSERYVPHSRHSTQHAAPVHGERSDRFERSNARDVPDMAHQFQSFPPPPHAGRPPDPPRGSAVLPAFAAADANQLRPPSSFPREGDSVYPGQSSYMFSGNLAGGSGRPRSRDTPVGYPSRSPSFGGPPDIAPPPLPEFERFGRHRAATPSSSRPSAGTRGDDDAETEDSVGQEGQEMPRESGSDGGASSTRVKRTPSQSPGLERRPKRVSRKTEVACDFCRGRKLRCDGRRPTCKNCFRRGNVCVYADAPRRRGPGKNPRGSKKHAAASTRASSAEQGHQRPQFQVDPDFVPRPPRTRVTVAGEPQFAFPPPAGVEPPQAHHYTFPPPEPAHEPPGPSRVPQAWPDAAGAGQAGAGQEEPPDMMQYLQVPSPSPESPR